MKSIISSHWLRRSGTFLAGIALALMPLGVLAQPASTTPLRDLIATRMMELQGSEKRWIQIDITNQRLIAWQGANQVYAVVISTGKGATPTRAGTFTIQTKLRTDRMRGPGYDVPDVPFTMYYHGGYAIHGAYWHQRFGTPVSHGCVNVAVNHAKWLFNWASVGTPVVIHE